MIPVVESDGRIIGLVSRSHILTEKLNEKISFNKNGKESHKKSW